jgi:acyl-coenzyme A synthetase/AMP-(fatty) acid ligase
VREAAAVASPDPKRGNIVKAFVRVVPGTEKNDDLIARLQEHVRDTYAAYAYPREIEFVDELPKTLTGKIRRIELRQAEMDRKKGAAT